MSNDNELIHVLISSYQGETDVTLYANEDDAVEAFEFLVMEDIKDYSFSSELPENFDLSVACTNGDNNMWYQPKSWYSSNFGEWYEIGIHSRPIL